MATRATTFRFKLPRSLANPLSPDYSRPALTVRAPGVRPALVRCVGGPKKPTRSRTSSPIATCWPTSVLADGHAYRIRQTSFALPIFAPPDIRHPGFALPGFAIRGTGDTALPRYRL